jgi:hypothetical protein
MADAPAPPTKVSPDPAKSRIVSVPSATRPTHAPRSRPRAGLGRMARCRRQSARPTAPLPPCANLGPEPGRPALQRTEPTMPNRCRAIRRQNAGSTAPPLRKPTPAGAAFAGCDVWLVTILTHSNPWLTLKTRQQGGSVGLAAHLCQSLEFCTQSRNLPMDGFHAGDARFSPCLSRNISDHGKWSHFRDHIVARLCPNLGNCARFGKNGEQYAGALSVVPAP